MRHLAYSLLCFMAMAPAAVAASAPTVESPWIRYVPGRENAAAYLSITASTDDELTGVHSDCCDAVEVHEMTMDGDVMQMREVDAVALPKGEAVAFQPLGYHLMLMGLKDAPAEGSTISLTLEFASGTSTVVPFSVKPLSHTAPSHDHTHTHGEHH